MGRSDLLIKKSNNSQVTSGSPFVIITYIKIHINQSDYSKYEVISGNDTVSISNYIKKHKSLW